MTAGEQFAKGDRVRLTADGIVHLGGKFVARKTGPYTRDTRGTVRGFSPRHPYIVRVQRDGLTSIDAYHMRLWERDT